MSIKRIHHAQITVAPADVAQAREFYTEVMGFTEIPKPDSLRGRGGLWLQVGQQELHIGTEDNPPNAATKAHLAYEVSELSEWRQRLTDTGITRKESIAIPGYERLEFRDPFGNRVELIQRLHESAETTRQTVLSGAIWEAQVGYARAVRVGQMVYVAGTTASNRQGEVMGATAAAQTDYIIRKIEQALTECGASLQDVVRTRMFVSDVSLWQEIGAVHERYFGSIRPVTTMVEVSRLIGSDYLVEIEADAVLSV